MKKAPTPEEVRLGEVEKACDKVVKRTADQIQKLTPKQRKSLTLLVADPSLTDAEVCRQAGYQVTTDSRAQHVLKPIKGILGTVLREQCGITEGDLAKAFTEGLRAEKIVVSNGVIVNLGADTKVRVDTAFRLAKLGGYEAPGRLNIKHEHSVASEGMDVEKLRKRERQQNELLEIPCEVANVVN